MEIFVKMCLSGEGFANLLFPWNNFHRKVSEGEKEPIGFHPIESTCLTKEKNELLISFTKSSTGTAKNIFSIVISQKCAARLKLSLRRCYTWLNDRSRGWLTRWSWIWWITRKKLVNKVIYFSLSFFGPEPGAGVFPTCMSSISAFLNPAIILQFPFFDSSDIVS